MPPRGLCVWFVVLAILALLSRERVRDARTSRCNLDGVAIQPLRRVDLMRGGEVLASFCSITCALSWPDRPPHGFWRVRDEATGRAIDAALAHFVESRVASDAAHGERVHVFLDAAEAARHCDQFDGAPLPNPLLHTTAGSSKGAER